MAERERVPLIAGNWKMHLLRADAERYCSELLASPLPEGIETVLFPSFPLLAPVAEAIARAGVGLGAQDLHAESAGAFTGDVSAAQIVDALLAHDDVQRP